MAEAHALDHLIWSEKWKLWYRPASSGYTEHFSQAGRYTREHAEREANAADCLRAVPISEVASRIRDQIGALRAEQRNLTDMLAAAGEPLEP